MKMTKRKFLQSVGTAAGVGALYRTMNALGMLAGGEAYAASPNVPSGSGQGKRVVILGAGVSGMVAAWELMQAGYECTILEATQRAGGRNLTARSGDVLEEEGGVRQRVDFDREEHLYANMGPGRIPYHHRALLGYCKQFGVKLEVFTNDNRAAFFHNSKNFQGRPVTGRRVRTDVRGYIAELLAKAVDQNALNSTLTSEDKEQLLSMLTSYGDLDADRFYKGSSRGGYQGTPPHAGLGGKEKDDALDFSELLQSNFWQYQLHFSDFLDQNPTLFQPVGGMDAIVKAFEQRVASRLYKGRVVEEIRKTGTGVRIVAREADSGKTEAFEGDFAICAIPAPILVDIPNDFSAATQKALASVKFTAAAKVAFQMKRRFWEEDDAIYGGISWTDQDITQIWYPANGYQQKKGVLVGAYIWDERHRKALWCHDPRPAPARGIERWREAPRPLQKGDGKWSQSGLGPGALSKGRVAPRQRGRTDPTTGQWGRGHLLCRGSDVRTTRLAGGRHFGGPWGGGGHRSNVTATERCVI